MAVRAELKTHATMSNITQRRCREQNRAASGQLALRSPLSAPDFASGCPKLRPSSANQPRRPRLPAISGELAGTATGY
eukprot:scaffold34845_cov63-Phaeocystis_antarctica.AAC.1